MAKLQYKEFKHKVENGTITDLKPYISYSGAFRVLIASKGQHINELLAYQEPDVMVELINNGYASEHYEEWKSHKDKRVREALAQQGFWPEVFIEDENRDVRAGVILAHPEMMRRAQESNSEWYAVQTLVEDNPNATRKDIDFFLSLKPHERDYGHMKKMWSTPDAHSEELMVNILLEAYRQKLNGFDCSTTLIERTMTTKDLYQIGHPAWTCNVSLTQIINLLQYRDESEQAKSLEQFEQHFDELLDASHDYWERYDVLCNIGAAAPF